MERENVREEEGNYLLMFLDNKFVITSMIITTGVCWMNVNPDGDCIHFD